MSALSFECSKIMCPAIHITEDEKGYALPIVMVISLIIMLITMSITFSVREKIRTASELNDRSMAYLRSYSAMNEVVYNILTSTFSSFSIDFHDNDGSVTNWNLYGKPIALEEGVSVSLRDISGMLSPLFKEEYLKKVIAYATKDTKKAAEFYDALSDWQDKDDFKRLNGAESFEYKASGYSYTPRNYYLQVIDELKLIKGFDAGIYEAIKDDLVYWSSSLLNYLTLSEATLRALIGDNSLVDTIVDLREKGELTGRIFNDLTNIPETNLNTYHPSLWIKIDITAKVGKAVDHISSIIYKGQIEKKPYMVAEWRR